VNQRDNKLVVGRIAISAVGFCVSSSCGAQLIHVYEKPSEQLLGLYLPALVFVVSCAYLLQTPPGRKLAAFLVLGIIGILAALAIPGGGILLVFALIFCPWPIAIASGALAARSYVTRKRETSLR